MSAKIFFILCHPTVHPVNIHIIRPNDRNKHVRCKGWTEGEWAQSTGNGRDQIIKNMTVNFTILLKKFFNKIM